MFWTNVKRVLRLGLINFARNGSVSLAAILIMTITLMVISSLFFTRAVLNSTLMELENAVDIRVYLSPSAAQSDMDSLEQQIKALPEVANVTYSSSQQELDQFTSRHQSDQLTLQALAEVGTNPFGPAFLIKAKNSSQYDSIASFLSSEQNQSDNSIIETVNYTRNKTAIDTVNKIITASKTLGAAAAGFFILISILITYNTIALAIYMAREEISVMRLVGASTRYIRWPFVVSGLIYGFCGAVLCLILVSPMAYWVGPKLYDLGTGINVFKFYLSNIFEFIGIILLSGLAIGSVSSYLAVRRYLKI